MTPPAALAVALLSAAALSLWTAGVAWRHRDARGGRPLTLLMLASSWLALTTLGALTADGFTELLRWQQIRYVGYVAIPPAWLLFALEYAGLERFSSRRLRVGLATVAGTVLITVATIPLHDLFYVGGSYAVSGGVPSTNVGTGPLYWATISYAYVLMGTGTALVIRQALRTRRLFRRQALLLVGFAIVPWAANAVAVAGIVTTPIDPTVLVTAPAGALGAVGLYRSRVLDAAPVVRGEVLDHLDDGVLVLDEDDRVIDHNATMAPFFRETPAVGRPLDAVVPAAIADHLDRENRESTDDEHDCGTVDVDRDGETRTFDVRRSTLTDTAGDAIAFVYLFRDVTERRRREEALRRRNEELDRFAGVVSHDLRNPLNVAGGFLDLARESGEPEQFDRVERAHDRMDAIIDDLLALARTEDDVDPVRVPLAEAARTAWEHVDTADATLRVSVPDGHAVVADRGRLARLFENLFRNAIEHGGSTVTVTVDAGDGRFAIADDGPGVPDDIAAGAFEPGTSGADGTGLGLAIVRSVAEAHGWTVTIDGDAAGARFVVRGVETGRDDTFGDAARADADEPADTTIRND
ncbi:PAS domain-containing protein [Halobaculum sp. WSA2]|uniref:histidine kinase n=1 Tax=Halobaculum saliterrae TaxID=2073113 RepID=A0A6B0SPK3_9EURY|nr:histidine kinase N-terminal 7TM domain-containing protein [Halobaculum saliterrae]MXR40848.1 PAS domain-containing protein [Halobaculum saliterrae]